MISVSQVLLGVLVLGTIVDIGTTIKILEQGGHEKNPLLQKLMAKIGIIPALLVFKVALVLGLYTVAFAFPEALAVACFIQVGVCIYNLRSL